jgi:hypothetical protein
MLYGILDTGFWILDFLGQKSLWLSRATLGNSVRSQSPAGRILRVAKKLPI